MNKNFTFAFFMVILTTISITNARGGRGGGGGRSSGRGSFSRSSRGSFSNSGSKSYSGHHTGQHSSGSWYHGFFHTPYYYSYMPTHTNRVSASSYNVPRNGENKQSKDTSGYAVGYAISRSLSSDFFAIFNMVHDISKIPDKVKSKEYLPSTTTLGPVSTYNINQIIENPYAGSNLIFEVDSKSNPDEEVLVDIVNSNYENDNDSIEDENNTKSSIIFGSRPEELAQEIVNGKQ